MVNAEVMKSVGEYGKEYGKQKANEALSNPEKFQATLDKISQNSGFLKLRKIRDEASQEDKERAYNAGKQMWTNNVVNKIVDPLKLGILQSAKSADPILGTVNALRYKSNQLKSMKLLAPGQTFEPAMRLCVHLGLLSKPNAITPENMVKDMQLDFKSLNAKLTVLEAVATVVPRLRPALPLIQELKKYANQLWETGVQTLINRQSDKQTVPENTPESIKETYPPKAEAAKDTTKLKTGIQTGKVKEDVTNNTAPQQEKTQQIASENKGNVWMGNENKVEHVAN